MEMKNTFKNVMIYTCVRTVQVYKIIKTIILHHIYNSRQQLYTSIILLYTRGRTYHVDDSLCYIKYII